jgi:hypothetical protein
MLSAGVPVTTVLSWGSQVIAARPASVDLPAPLGPVTRISSPGRAVNDTSRSAIRPEPG